MEGVQSFPFKAGDRVESRSFMTGFRGAWFRCEVKKICQRETVLGYCDLEGTQKMRSIYHKAPWKPTGAKKDLMLRPQFPPVYRQGEVPDVNTLSEVIVVTNGAWKVGDLADWYCDDCYWSGKITEVRGDGKVQFRLHPKPLGEGLLYEAFCKDLRPSLEWSQESGWTVPVPKGKPNYCPCAWLIQPINQGKVENEGKKDSEAAQESPSEHNASASPSLPGKLKNKGKKDNEAAQEFPPEHNASASPSSVHSLPSLRRLRPRKKGPENQTAVTPQEERQAQGRKMDADVPGESVGKRSYSDSVSSASVRASAEVPGETLCKEDAPENETSKRVRLSKSIPLNSSTCDSMQSLFVDLEELLNRVKWVRRFLELPESGKAGWKFQESRAGGSRPDHK